ncbi:MAG TPA: PQQ-binding-like beta-propeller repeat protein [Candidatus Hydrogenedentes bacterium]|nr:PQQ-binding-like beta-propeller repeat protein [Candidatus Hydrogenedentota bacterium]HOL78300.1 PQQ-binding-like beta-propeller repeat protein [Candidatus Hydrogenedentota bacterium]HPO85985.1 PQQ-binding-like beta-propeller repeat protein [Candidatus Hydrogenedentota bacterium]
MSYPFLVCLPLLSLASPSSAHPAITMTWTADLKTFLESCPTVADINEDGIEEILVVGREEIIAVDGGGTVLWRTRGEGRFMTYPAVFKGHKPALIYAADCAGWLHCYDASGNSVWKRQLAGPNEWSAPVMCDLMANGTKYVIQTDIQGGVWAFDAVTGEVFWHTKVDGAPVSPAVADLNADGFPEVVVATNSGKAFCLDKSGKVLWERVIGGASPTWATGAPIIFSASDGSLRVAVPAAEGVLLCLNGEGSVLWRKTLRGPIASALSAGDLDADGIAEIFAITQLGVIYRFSENGEPLWEIDMQGRTLAAGAILDVDGDGKRDFVLATQQGLLLALDNQGRIFYEWQAPSRTINVTPTFGRLSPKDTNLSLVLSGGEAGVLYCFKTAAKESSEEQWIAYRANAEKTGAWLGLKTSPRTKMYPLNLSWDRLCIGDTIRFAIETPQRPSAPLTATARVLHPDGLQQSVSTKVVGQRGELHLLFQPSAPGAYAFSWQLEDQTGGLCDRGNRSITFDPFANEIGLVRTSIEKIEVARVQVKDRLPLSEKALKREEVLLTSLLDDLTRDRCLWQQAREQRDSIVQVVAETVEKARRAANIADLIVDAANRDNLTGIAVSEGMLWENRGLEKRVPSRAFAELAVQRQVVPGEHEPLVFDLFNLTERELVVRVKALAKDKYPSIRLLRPAAVPSSSGELVWDALPELDRSRTMTIPPLENRQLWCDFDFADVAPGIVDVEIRLEVLNGPGVLEPPHNPQTVSPPTARIAASFQILPFSMAPSSAMRLCTWAKPDPENLADLVSHGNNVFIISMPQCRKGKDADADEALDTEAIDPVLERLASYDVFLLLSGTPDFGCDFGSETYQRKLSRYLPLLVTHLKEKGVDLHHFALYPWDEPGGHGWHAVEHVAKFGEMVKAIQPEVLVYVNGGGERPMFERMAPTTDIWCPSIYMLPDKSPEMDIVRKTGKMLWSYNCAYGFARPVGANIKDINVIAEFRTAALFALRHGASGIGFWCYNIGDDMWQRVRDEYPLVYPAEHGTISSRRWEAVREGIEDYRILVALREYVDNPNNKVNTPVRDRVNKLISGHLTPWMDQGFEEMKLGLARYVLDLTHNDEAVRAFRQELIACTKDCCAKE